VAKRHLAPEKIATMAGLPLADVQAFHEASDGVFLLDALCKEYKGQQGLPSDVRETAYYQEEYRPLMQAMDSATAAEGLEFIPTQLSSSLIERVNLDLMVVQLFGGIVQMPTNPWKIPGRAVTRQRMGKHAEQTADTGQTGFSKRTPGSRNVTLTASSSPARRSSRRRPKRTRSSRCSRSCRTSWSTGSPPTRRTLRSTATPPAPRTPTSPPTTRGRTGTASASSRSPRRRPTCRTPRRPSRTRSASTGRRWAATASARPTSRTSLDVNAYIQLLADSSVITMEKYGPNATIVTGELGRVDGSPVVVSEYVRQDLNATGVFDNVTTNRTEIVTVYNRGFIVGEKRGQNIQVLRELYAEYDQDAILISLRRAFAARFPTATEPIVAVSYNIAA
jgi:hypothetical protein